MLIRPAQVSDAGAIAKVHVDSWRTTYRGIVPDSHLQALSYEQRTSRWQNALSASDDQRFVYVAEKEAGKVIGFAGGNPERSGNKIYTGELGVIYLDQAYQRRGVGRRLVAQVAEHLLRLGHHTMLTWVVSTNLSRKFYEVLGGQPVAEKEVEIGGVTLIEVAYGWQDIQLLAGGSTMISVRKMSEDEIPRVSEML